MTESYSLALEAMENIHCCGKERMKRVTLSLVQQAYEPQIFKTAFKSGWIDFNRPDQALGGAIEEENSSESDEESKAKAVDNIAQILDSKTLKEAQAKLPNHCWLN